MTSNFDDDAYDDALQELGNRQALIRDRIIAVAKRYTTGFYLWGRPGTSKTYLVQTTLSEMGATTKYHSGHLTPIGLFDLIQENPDAVIILDDVSNLYDNPTAMQILLAALGQPPVGERGRVVTHKTATSTRSVEFRGGIICLTNRDLTGHHDEVLDALADRIHVMHYNPTDQQILAQINELARRGVRGVSADDCLEVARFLRETCAKFSVRPSLRLFLDKAIPDFLQSARGEAETDWRDRVRATVAESVVELHHPVRPLKPKSIAEQHAEQRVLIRQLRIASPTSNDLRQLWMQETKLSAPTFFRRMREVEAEDRQGFSAN